ncbi:hypothetical protein MCAP1_001251 [Malassezia caprae]|uniref:BHLH domain-containing protein n=1 Tax=Malassezia caprae TaxID=1381934 RepID=A0AAF0E988_9BASI|nr:hypothetical protein MCAP1_001251 [Malassezia caprae]
MDPMDAWRQLAGLDPTMERPLYEDNKPWKGVSVPPTSPKPWSSVDLPDLFLTNLIHDVDHTFTDDSLTDFSGSGGPSGSEAENSPHAFRDFLLRNESPECIETSSAPLFTQSAPGPMFDLASVDFAPVLPMFPNQPMPQASAPVPQPAFCAPPASVPPPLSTMAPVTSVPSMHETTPSPASVFQSPISPVSSSSSAMTGQGLEESLLAPIRMRPGSNVDARSALVQLRSSGAPEPACVRPKLNRASSSSSATTVRRPSTAPKTAPGDEASPWSKKTAHNAIERRYRSNINDRIAGLRDVVPALREMRPRDGRRKRRRGKAETEELVDGVTAATKFSKAAVLTKATEYICYLKSREVQLSREVAGLHMLVRSLDGGEELLAQFSAEMDKIHSAHPPVDAVYGDASPRPIPEEGDDLADDSDDGDDADDSASSDSAEPERAAKTARYMFGAFAGLSFMGRSTDWGASTPPASAHVRVLGASHQLVKRATPYLPEPHTYDRVPLVTLLVEVLQVAALVLGVLALFFVIAHRVSAWLRRQSVNKARKLQTAQPASMILPSPMEHVASSPLLTRDKATRAYDALGTQLQIPTTSWGLSLSLAWQCILLMLAHVPGVRYLWTRAVDPTTALLTRRSFVRRGEMELSLGDESRCGPLRYWHTVLALERFRALYGLLVDEQLLLALLHYHAARRVYVPWAMSRAVRLWRSAGVALVDEPKLPDDARRRLASILSLPLPVAWAHVRDASGTDGPLSVSPLSNLMEALRDESLLSYWTTVLASMMRASDSSSAQACLSPVVLDVVSDAASLTQLQKDLGSLTNECPPRTAPAAEQLVVAHGVLALTSGQVRQARHMARTLAAMQTRTRGASEFVALLHDTESSRSMSPVGPVDMLSCVAIGWMRLQRANALGDASQRSTKLVAAMGALQTLASQCLWTFVSPEPIKGVEAETPLPRSCSGLSLEHALDTLMDNLSVMAVPV